MIWPDNAADAIAMQKSMVHKLRIEDAFDRLDLIAGIDCSYDLATETSFAIVVTMQADRLHPIETVRATLPTTFPYIPGLLSFREIPVVLKALQMLNALPDVLMVDGQGIAHPRRLGIAAHLGVLTGLPALGVAKSRLTGHHKELGPHKGDHTPLTDKGEIIGTVLRSKEKTNPLFISAGHRVSQQTALNLTLKCLTSYRLPEPTRIADKVSKIKPGITDQKESHLL